MVASTQGYSIDIVTALSTELDALVSDNHTVLSAEQSQDQWKDYFVDVEIYLNTVALTNETIEVYLLPSIDGTNFPDWAADANDNPENNQYYAGSITFEKTTSKTHRQMLRGVSLPPGKFKIAIRNKTGTTLNATGNTVKIRPAEYGSA